MPLFPIQRFGDTHYFSKTSDKGRRKDIRRYIMSIKSIPIDLSDIPEVTDLSMAQRNPYAEKIRKNGYSITIHYSPEDVAAQVKENVERVHGMDMSDLDQDERRAFERYLEANKQYLNAD
jgi:hypothetical protein